MTAIRAIFDGKSFVPQQAVSLPAQSEAIILIDAVDPAAQKALDDSIRAYYQSGSDTEDEAWGRGLEKDLHRAWDED